MQASELQVSGFGADAEHYEVTVRWKHGFEHSYDQKLTPKQVESEKERYSKYRWVETVDYVLVEG